MINVVYKSAYQQGYNDAKNDFRKMSDKELSRDMEEIAEVINCDAADAEAKYRMISDILTAKPHYFADPIEIVETKEVEESEIKYLNINISNGEVERNPDIVRLCSDAGTLEYVKQKTVTEEIIALLKKTYADFCESEGGEGWFKIDGKEYNTDVGYAIDGMLIFMEVFKQRLAERQLPSVNPQQKTGYWISRPPYGFKCSKCLIVHRSPSLYCPSCGAKMIKSPESEE